MSNRIVPILLLIIAMGIYFLWKNPSTHDDMVRVKKEVAKIPDKAIEGAAKVSNRIEDANIPERTERAMENLKDDARETKNEIKEDFNDAKRRDRIEQGTSAN